MRSTDYRREAADQNACVTEKNGTTVDENELLGAISQGDQKQTYLSTHQISKEMVLAQGVIQIIHCDLSLKCLFIYQCDFCLLLVLLTFIFYKIVWQHSLGVVGYSITTLIANCPENVLVKKC